MIGASGNIASLRVGAQLAWRLTSLQLRDRYASTLFGSFWAVLQPAALIAVYWFVFSYGLRASNPSEHTPFFLVLIAGLVVWFFFSDAVLGGTTAVTAASYLVKKIAFPLEVLPFVPVLSALSIHGVMLLIVLGFMVANGIFPDVHTLWFAYYMVALLCLAVGLSCLLSAINVFQKDIGQAAGILMQIWFWLTPIVWSPDLFPATVRKWLELNPLYYIVMGYRQALFPDLKVALSWQSGAAFWAFTIVSLLVGSAVFRRLKPDFADFL